MRRVTLHSRASGARLPPMSESFTPARASSHAILLVLGFVVAGLGAIIVSATLPASPLPSSGDGLSFEPLVERPVAEQRAEQNHPLAPVRHVMRVKSGTGMMRTLLDADIPSSDAHGIIRLMGEHIDLRRIPAGQEVTLIFPPPASSSVKPLPQPPLEAVSVELDAARSLRITRLRDGWHAEVRTHILHEREFHISGRIDSTLYGAAQAAGLRPSTVNEMIRIFSHNVDFQRDIRKGDEFEVFFTQKHDRHERVADNKPQLLHLSLKVQGKSLQLWRHEDPATGFIDYFDADGRSMKRLLMRTPINGARLSSGFGMRKHPILGYSRMHQGLDYAAPSGTPIYASGNGTITYIGNNGNYGKMIRLRHANGYETLYAHMSGFAKGMKKGRRVEQEETIGYVGSTGLSTGPHLHYEVHHRGKSLNPQSLDIPLGRVLEGAEMEIFQAERMQMRERMAQSARIAGSRR